MTTPPSRIIGRDDPRRSVLCDRLSATLAEVRALRDDLASRHACAEQAADDATTVAARAADRFRATGHGIAHSMRDVELAAAAGRDRQHLRSLQQRHVAAENASDGEYRRRTDLWGHHRGDGPFRGCPIGTLTPVTTHLLHDQVLGSYRHDPTEPRVRVRLYRQFGDRLLRTTVTVTRSDPTTLSGVFTTILANRDMRTRVLARLDLVGDRYPLTVENPETND